jgi:hypothetical protein
MHLKEVIITDVRSAAAAESLSKFHSIEDLATRSNVGSVCRLHACQRLPVVSHTV